MLSRDLPADKQAKAEPALISLGITGTEELAKETRLIFRSDADALVFDSDRDDIVVASGITVDDDLDREFDGTILDRILDQIAEHLIKSISIPHAVTLLDSPLEGNRALR